VSILAFALFDVVFVFVDAFILSQFWMWFAVPLFHIDAITFQSSVGLTVLVDFIQHRTIGMNSAASKLISSQKKIELTEDLMDWMIQIIPQTRIIALIVGFIIHIFVDFKLP
jgi:hypothetical protein